MSDGGKGSSPRPYSVDRQTFESNWNTIFKKNPGELQDAINEDEAFKYIEDRMQVRVAEEGKKIGTCGCGRSPTGDCIGWHGLNEEQLKAAQEKYQAQLTENK